VSEDIEVLGGLRAELGPIRSKPDPVDQPERTAHYDCAMLQCALLKCYTILGYSTETVLLIFPFLQTNITVEMRPSGGWGTPI